MEKKIYSWKKQKEVERVSYRGGIMEILHTTVPGKMLMRHLLSLPLINRLITRRKYLPDSRREIRPFIEQFQLDEKEFDRAVEEYTSFSDFFTRRLIPSARPVASGEKTIVSPCDGVVSFFADISKNNTFMVKGTTFSLETIVGDSELAKQFQGGSAALFYLAPQDYHRFHFPFSATIEKHYVRGNRLFSVSPLSLNNGFRPFDVNVRHINHLKTRESEALMLEIGAFYVGKIKQTYGKSLYHLAGEEKGYFDLGGSSILLIFPHGAVEFSDEMVKKSETYDIHLVMGEQLGRFL